LNGNKSTVGATVTGSKETRRPTLSTILTVSRPSRAASVERTISTNTGSDDPVEKGN